METTDFATPPAAEPRPEPTPEPVQPPPASSWRPADYYSAPPRRPVVPRWLTFGCGGAAVLVMLIVFVGGALLSTSAIGEFMDMALGMTMGEVRGMYAKDVTAEQKKGFEDEVEGVRKNLREEKISIRALDPLMRTVRAASRDNKIERAEVEQMQAAARTINAGAKRK